MDANQRFATLAGICWHEYDPDYDVYCRKCRVTVGDGNPDFSDPIAVIRVMMSREDWDLFLPNIGHCHRWKEKDTIYAHDLIRIDYLLTPGLLRDKAVEFLEGKNG